LDSCSGFNGINGFLIRFLIPDCFLPSAVRLRIQWHVIIAVQRGVCVMLGLAKDMAIQAAAAAAATTFSS